MWLNGYAGTNTLCASVEHIADCIIFIIYWLQIYNKVIGRVYGHLIYPGPLPALRIRVVAPTERDNVTAAWGFPRQAAGLPRPSLRFLMAG